MEIYKVDVNERIICIGKFYIPNSILSNRYIELMTRDFKTIYDEIEFIKSYNYSGDRFEEAYLMIMVEVSNRKRITSRFVLDHLNCLNEEEIFITNSLVKFTKEGTIEDIPPEKILQNLKIFLNKTGQRMKTFRLVILWCLLRKPYVCENF